MPRRGLKCLPSMEFLYSTIFLVMVICYSSTMIYFHLFNKKRSNDHVTKKLPPGKFGWPIIGETLELASATLKCAPEKFVEDRVRKYGSTIFKTSLFGETFAVLCGSNGNKFLFSNEKKLVQTCWPRTFDKIFPLQQIQFSLTEVAKSGRVVTLNRLKPEALRRYVGIMDAEAKKHFEKHWENKGEVLVYPLVVEFIFRVACRLLLGMDDPYLIKEMENQFLIVSSGLFSVPINLPGTRFYRAIKGRSVIQRKIVSIVKQKKIELFDQKRTTSSPLDDILSHMILTSDEDGLFASEVDIANYIIGLLIAGHDTTRSSLTLIMFYLADHPEIYDKVFIEQIEIAKSKTPEELLNWDDIKKMKYSWNVACETLRLKSPISGTFREAISDFSYEGFSVPKGWKLHWNASWTHMNPDYFLDPEKFDPSRFEGNGPAPYTFVPFGGGPRMCPGIEYAKIKLLVFIHNAVINYRWAKLIPTETVTHDPFPIPSKGLPVCLQRN